MTPRPPVRPLCAGGYLVTDPPGAEDGDEARVTGWGSDARHLPRAAFGAPGNRAPRARRPDARPRWAYRRRCTTRRCRLRSVAMRPAPGAALPSRARFR